MNYITEKWLREQMITVEPPKESRSIYDWLNGPDESLLDKGEIRWLLAHTFTGLVWGRREADGWHLSSELNEDSADEIFPRLDTGTVLHLRLFGKKGEIYIWRDGERLRGRAIFDESENLIEAHQQAETHILWGTKGEVKDKFTVLSDGQQKLMHAFPLPLPEQAFGGFHRPARLHLRHYITRHEETGLARIALTRLYDVSYEEPSVKQKEASNGA